MSAGTHTHTQRGKHTLSHMYSCRVWLRQSILYSSQRSETVKGLRRPGSWPAPQHVPPTLHPSSPPLTLPLSFRPSLHFKTCHFLWHIVFHHCHALRHCTPFTMPLRGFQHSSNLITLRTRAFTLQAHLQYVIKIKAKVIPLRDQQTLWEQLARTGRD